jgi:CubicO group peptidase (beta-lactamase class C family)
MVSEPGMQFNYSEIDAHLLSMLISEISQMSTYEFAEKNLFHKSNFDVKETQWEKDQNNICYGDFGLRLKPLEILDFAKIYLNEGKINGDAIVTGQWVNETFRAYSNGGWPLHLKYGYMWWITEYSGYKAFIAYGSGTQFVCIIPELQMIIQMSCAEKILAEE